MITVATLFRDRFWILEHWLNSLFESIEYFILTTNYKEKILLYILVDKDEEFNQDTFDTIINRVRKYTERYLEIRVEYNECNMPKDQRVGSIRDKLIFRHLSLLRNRVLDFCIESNTKFLFSIDSDIIVNKECILELYKKLIENKDFVLISTFIANDFHKGKLGNIMKFNNNTFTHIREYNNSFIEVDITGAIFILDSRAFSYRYGYHAIGEDGQFCIELKTAEYKIGCFERLAQHFMTEEYFKEYQKCLC